MRGTEATVSASAEKIDGVDQALRQLLIANC